MEKLVSRKLKINAKETMRLAEKLYTQGFISYPRTETNIFPDSLNLSSLVEMQTEDRRWGGNFKITIFFIFVLMMRVCTKYESSILSWH